MTRNGDDPPRLAPDRPMPAYAYRPGKTPHPMRDFLGHSHGAEEPAPPAPDPSRWQESEDYLYGLDLFNRGYYWEAHEAWEGLWHACGREGWTADFLKALIALAAAGVKAREGNPAGVEAHGKRAAALLGMIARENGRFMGLDIRQLEALARAVADAPPVPTDDSAVAFGFILVPDRAGD